MPIHLLKSVNHARSQQSVNAGRLSHSLPQAANGRFAALISEVPVAGFGRVQTALIWNRQKIDPKPLASSRLAQRDRHLEPHPSREIE